MPEVVHFTAHVREQGAIGAGYTMEFTAPAGILQGAEVDRRGAMVDEIRRQGYELLGHVQVQCDHSTRHHPQS